MLSPSSNPSDALMDLTINSIADLQIASFKIYITNHNQPQYTGISDLKYLLDQRIVGFFIVQFNSDFYLESKLIMSYIFISIIFFNVFLVHAGVVPSNFDASNVLRITNGKCK